ncbi:hypothetical protein DL96DRAFT_1551365 [Flagelloscypha sp. PMI_526]|nr:hypothetical protein DL96DRAFT_1551365 [Flagelloscypha sp. PMI_526]
MTGTKVLNNIEDLRGRTVILLFGKSRAGKSTFINDAYGKTVAKSTGSMESDTDAITYVNEPLVIDQRSVVLVDSIGLGGSGENHDRVRYGVDRDGKVYPIVRGFLYFIDITDAAGLNEDNRYNLEIFKALIGEQVMESVIFVTTKWAGVNESARDDQDDHFEQWRAVIAGTFPGASIVSLDGDTPRCSQNHLARLTSEVRAREIAKYRENAVRTIRAVVARRTRYLPLLQYELRTGGPSVPISKTLVGKVITNQLLKIAKESEEAGLEDVAERCMEDILAMALTPAQGGKTIAETKANVETVFKGDDKGTRPQTSETDKNDVSTNSKEKIISIVARRVAKNVANLLLKHFLN